VHRSGIVKDAALQKESTAVNGEGKTFVHDVILSRYEIFTKYRESTPLQNQQPSVSFGGGHH
jgi:hypothetical protein